jgi:hypothetical protein
MEVSVVEADLAVSAFLDSDLGGRRIHQQELVLTCGACQWGLCMCVGSPALSPTHIN